jgi:hypothetical protein
MRPVTASATSRAPTRPAPAATTSCTTAAGTSTLPCSAASMSRCPTIESATSGPALMTFDFDAA